MKYRNDNGLNDLLQMPSYFFNNLNIMLTIKDIYGIRSCLIFWGVTSLELIKICGKMSEGIIQASD